MELRTGGVTAAYGFKAVGICAGIKKNKKDMAMLVSDVPCVAAGTFTTNVVKAAPVKWDREIILSGKSVSAVVVNSGVANACTGEEGYGYCKDTAQLTAEILGVQTDNVLVASTGVIGRQLPMDKIKEGIKTMVPLLRSTVEAGSMAAEAIMTTDTVKKEIAVTTCIDGKTVSFG